MPQVVDIPDVGEVEFPDGMTDEAVGHASKRLHLQAGMETARRTGERSERVANALSWTDFIIRPFASTPENPLGGLGSAAKGAGMVLNEAGNVAAGAVRDVRTAPTFPPSAFPATIEALQGRDLGPAPGGPVGAGLEAAGRTVPIVAGAMALQGAGVPAPLAFAGPPAASTLAHTGDTPAAVQAGLIGAAIPGIANLAREGAALALGRAVNAGVLAGGANTTQKIVEALAAQGAIQVFMEGMNVPAYVQMTPEERKNALIENLVANSAFLLLDVPGIARKTQPSATQGRIEPAVKVGEVLEKLVNDPASVEALRVAADQFAFEQLDPSRGFPGAKVERAADLQAVPDPFPVVDPLARPTSKEVMPRGEEAQRQEVLVRPAPTISAPTVPAAAPKAAPEPTAAPRPGDASEATRAEQPARPGGQPQPSTAPEPPVKRVGRGITGHARFIRETEIGGTDILDWIDDFGGMMSKSEARRRGAEWWKRNASLYDDATTHAAPHHNIIYRGGSAPDVVAQAAYDSGRLKSPDVTELWSAIRRATHARAGIYQNIAREAKLLKSMEEDHKAWVKATAKGEKRVGADELTIGDEFEVDGERVKVSGIDPDTGDVTLEDGRKFGTQVISEGTTIHVEKFKATETKADFGPPVEAFDLGKPETIAEQQQRLIAEEKLRAERRIAEEREATAKRTMLKKAAAPLGGDLGSAGQGGLFVEPGQQEIFQTKPPRGTSGIGHPIPALPPVTAAAVPGTHRFGTLPVAMERMVRGKVDVPSVMASLENVMQALGSEVPIRTGRFYQNAIGIYKSFVETIRLKSADDIPTAAHEVAHAVSDVVFGSTKSRPLMAAVRSRPAIAELRTLGRALYGSRKPVAGYTAEGFSELVRLWLTTEDAARRAPLSTRWFEDTLLPAWPDMAKALKQARDLIDVWRGQGARGRAEAQMKSPGRLDALKRKASDQLSYEAQVEQFAPLEELSTGFAKQTGRRLPTSQDPFLIATAKRGSAGAVLDTWVERNMTDVWGNATGPGLREALTRVKPGEAKDFAYYLWARRALERWGKNKNPGMAIEDAQHLRASLETPAFIDAAQKFYQWWDGALEYVKQAAPAMNGALIDAIRTGSSDYVPLARMLDPRVTKGQAAGHGGGGLYKMHGSGLPIRNIYEQSLLVAERLIGRAHRDLVLDAVFKLSRHEGMGWLVEQVPRTRVMEKVNVEKIRRELEGYGVDTSAIPEDTLISYATHLDKPSGTDPIMVRQTAAGPEWYQVPARVYDLLQGLDPARLGTVADMFVGAPNRLFKMGTTGLRASFSLVTNPARDLPTFMMQSIYGNPASRAGAYLSSMFDIVRAGLGGKVSPEWEAFHRLGIGGGMFLGGDIQHAKREARSLFRGKRFRRIASPVESLRDLLSFTEAIPRLAEMRLAGKEMGWTPGRPLTPEQAIAMSVAAKRITTDFSAAGSEGRMWNQMMPFYNATIQGTRAFLRAFKRDQGIKDVPHRALFTVLKGAALLTVPALLNWWRNKDEDWYRGLPWRERFLYTNVDDGNGGVVQVPRPPEWGQVFMVLPEALFDAWYLAEKEQDPERAALVVREALTHILATQNPLSLPSTAETARQQWENRIAFFDRPIVPRGQEDLPPGEQRAYFSSKLATALGDAFPNTVSPRRVDAAIRSMAGGLGGDMAQFPADLMRALGLEEAPREAEPADVPVLGRLFRRGGQFSANNQALADFWDAAGRLDAQAQAARVRLRSDADATQDQIRALMLAGLVDSYRLLIKTELEVAARTPDVKARQTLHREAAQTAQAGLRMLQSLDSLAR